ncbi:SDR family NAD(P)-dependent oxidoreductase [Paraconexibacter sp.]|uniref:SDR family NAD(P)-dependent oxidoreductase n=1 Tax=Paraconexibacter sp. TaxID=2949640 RepID=UPI003563F10F
MPLPEPRPDHTALVTGASSGIGVDLARDLAGRGHNLVLVARREDRLTAIAAELAAQHGVRADVLACDLADPAARDALPARVADLGLTVSILVNNAGFGTVGEFGTVPMDRETGMVRLNCEAVVALTGAWAPKMRERRSGAVLVVASSAGFQPIPGQATYAASKAFALAFSEGLHAELRPHGVSVTALCPGPVQTEFAEVAGAEELFANAPGFSMVSPEEVARQAIAGLDAGKRVVVPGAAIKVATLGGRYTPRALLLPLMRRFYPV